MTSSQDKNTDILQSSALQVNLARTAAKVKIPREYQTLLNIVEEHYGVEKRTRELLIELNHPYINWVYVLRELRSLSVGDFYEFNGHPEGVSALKIIIGIYLRIITQANIEDVRETGIRYLFDFINTIVSDSSSYLERNTELVGYTIQSLLPLIDKHPALFRKCSGYIKGSLKLFMEKDIPIQHKPLFLLTSRAFSETYKFWLSKTDPNTWLTASGESKEVIRAYQELVHPLSHQYLSGVAAKNDRVNSASDKNISVFIDMPDYFQILNGYLLIADALEKSGAFSGRQRLIKLDFLFNILNAQHLEELHGKTLLEVNRCLKLVFADTQTENLNEFIRKIFRLLKKNISNHDYHSAILDCITTLGKDVFELNNHPIVDTFIEELIRFGFQYPEIRGSNTDWQIQVNPAHIKNIRSWLKIISLKPRWTKGLLSALIINLKLGGVFVRDTDLLQKDISSLLNTEISPAYNLVKQLLRIFPIYFSEIGAEGELRDTSTELDELTSRNDRLIYFLRKQCHVESNSLLVGFIEDIFRYWHSSDKQYIRSHLPAEVYGDIEAGGEYFDGMHRIFTELMSKTDGEPTGFLEWDKTRIETELAGITYIQERDRKRAALILRLFQLLYKKYNPQHIDLIHELEGSYLFEQTKIHSLSRALKQDNYYKSLKIILEFISRLKETILSEKKTVSFENIYHKRHIAAGIPSMYGTYKEEKFDAMGLTFRLESLATTLFQELIESLNLKFITKSTLTRIHECLWLYVEALELDGIATKGLAAKLKYVTSALQLQQFSIDQYIDIFQFIAKGIQDILRGYYIDIHRPNLPVIISQVIGKTRPDYDSSTSQEDEKTIYRESENFLRSIVSSAFGLQVLDTFINRIINTLSAELDKFKDNKQILNLVMAYTPEFAITPIYKNEKKIDNQILVGNKGYFLKQLASMGFPVPTGFILTTEVFRGYDAVVGYKYIFNDLSQRIYNQIIELEKIVGKKFGDPQNPLLLSVRSGATVSLPGMMHSFLNVGINERIAEGLSRKRNYRWAAWDSYRRFLQTWGMFQGLERDFFDKIIDSFKERYNVSRKIQFKPDQMKQVALTYRRTMEEKGIVIIDNPPEQLRHAILQVFASWYSEHARIYRHQMHLSDEWGTAVIVQSMVYGNLNQNSGSGVIFTRNPKGQSPNVTLYGDFIFGVQGDDIVSGLATTYPISEKQRVAERRDSSVSLETRFPEIYAELVRVAETMIYEKGFNHQEIEFTFENATRRGLFILQTRDMIQTETKKLKIFKDRSELRGSVIGVGIGVGGGALCGRAVYSEAEIRHYRAIEPDTPLILVRPDTVPDDVGILLQVDGLLTAKGGSTSHAAVTIPQLKKVGVVGFSKLRVFETEGYSTIDGKVLRGGDFIAIDGWSGAVYEGKHPIEAEETYSITL